MSLDARAYSWCSLGDLSEEGTSIAEDHAQTKGVIMLKGTINLKGIYRPTAGTVVHLAYSDGQNWIARLPLRLRVLSCFSDAIRQKTTVSVGCDLAFYEDRKEPQTLDTRDENTSVPEAVWRAATPPMSGSWLVGMILCILRLRHVGTISLTNYYTRQEFDMSAGYVEELGKLLSSEGYAARMNAEGKVEFIYKEPPLSTGPLLVDSDLIDINPINSGTLPGDAVYAKYTSLRLKAPDSDNPDNEKERKKRNWELEEVWSPLEKYRHTWTEYLVVPTGETRQRRDSDGYLMFSASDTPILEPILEVQGFEREEIITYAPYTITTTNYDNKDRVTLRTTLKNTMWGIERTETWFDYNDSGTISVPGSTGSSSSGNAFEVFSCNLDEIENQNPGVNLSALPIPPPGARPARENNLGEVKRERTIEWSPIGPIKMSMGLQRSFYEVKTNGFQYQSSYREVTYDKNEETGITRTTTLTMIPFINTFDGSESISRERNRRKPWEDVDPQVAVGLRTGGVEERIRTEREFGLQRRPSESQRTNDANKKTPNVEQKAEFAWAVGSAASQTSIELSPPYTPDDRIVGGGGSYSVIPSDAPQKALQYARLENRYLFGHRNGNGIQILPEMLPDKPLSIIYIRLNGCTAAFLANGRTWNIDPSGVTLTCDALFWGAIDGNAANAWFPMPPSATTLPSPVAVSTNANAKPANAINIPNGFNFQNPNLNTLFQSLPMNQAAVFAKTVTPGVLVKPFYETINTFIGAGSGMFSEMTYWIEQPPQETYAGGGAGMEGILIRVDETYAGGGAGMIDYMVALTYAGGGAGLISEVSQSQSTSIQITSSPINLQLGDIYVTEFVEYSELYGQQLKITKLTNTSYNVDIIFNANYTQLVFVGFIIGSNDYLIYSINATATGVNMVESSTNLSIVEDLPSYVATCNLTQFRNSGQLTQLRLAVTLGT